MACPYLINDILIFPREGWECPADIEGFKRESIDSRLDGAWRFHSLWPACPYRQLIISRTETCQKIKMQCPQKKTLQVSDCRDCLVGER